MVKSASKLHAIVVPLPYQGHINPAISLAIKLASKGITITFIHTQYVHHTLTQAHRSKTGDEVDFFSGARKSGLDIRYSTISDGFPIDFDRGRNFDAFWVSFLRDFPGRVDEFIGSMMIQRDPCWTFFLITDTFFSWAPTIANKYGLVNVSFWTQTALVFSIGYHLDLLSENGHCPTKDNAEEEITYLPGIEAISTKDLMPYLKESETTKQAHIVSIKAFEEAKKADFILINTVEELELKALSALNQKKPIYVVGPVNFIRDCAPPAITKSLWTEMDCEKWLESKHPGSVLYVSFGSLAQISKQELEEIAYGLLLSEVHFIWVVRADIASEKEFSLPDGFENQVKDKGLIVPWCDQVNVLSNPAVGLFLTHCGWNSILESIWCGVPMICHPYVFDQPPNRKLIVEDWKVGVNLIDGVSVHREEVAEKIKNLMSGTVVGQGLRQEVEKAKMILHNAIETNGSSDRKFDQFIQDLENKICS
ncbi:hypothetical protein F511_10511 [Dorcoceras hygrometricum]|uniref:Glycosyltransferase n=1 Tax=Dorcoceras hygrometricum TaxID=472368 RepID=A0A2Z7ADD1_9LAMI|nr:hypothetical protein F511_10511 [Dorcoceras hygrometricum]